MAKQRQRLPAGKQFIDFIKEAARFTFAKTGQHAPQVVALHKDGQISMMVVEFTGEGIVHHAERDAFAGIIRDLANSGDVEELCFIAECWMRGATSVDEVEKKYQDPNYTVANEPDRQEIIQIIHATPNGERGIMALIERPLNGSPLLGAWEDHAIESGRFTAIFNKVRGERN